MNEPGRSDVAIALLYETRERSDHLREALAGLGARIVYEAVAAAFDAGQLEGSRANVVVVNLDADEDPALDALYALLDDPRYRVVFNDGSVSAGLSGWDQARWLRHLASKIFEEVDLDPPRPADAEAVPSPVRASKPAAEMVAGASARESASAPESVESLLALSEIEGHSVAASESESDGIETAAVPAVDDIDALLADLDVASPSAPAGESADVTFDTESFGLADFDLSEASPPPDLPDEESFGEAVSSDGYDPAFEIESPVAENATAAGDGAGDPGLAFDLDLDAPLPPIPDAPEAAPAPASTSAPAIEAPLEWTLEDLTVDAPDEDRAVREAKPSDFGIETMTPAEYLAPDVVDDPRAADEFKDVEFSLELVPLEEAVSPAAERPAIENWSDTETRTVPVIRRVWVLGASIGGPEAVREFLAEFPRNYPALFLLAQHLGAEFVDMMARQLAKVTPMTVRMPSHGERVGQGEVVIVPTTHRLRVDPAGVIVLEKLEGDLPYSPSIDRVIEDVAERFGDAAGAIVFSGVSDDALQGCRVLAQKGGRVYVQSPETCVVSAMVDAVMEAGIAGFSGSPKELAAKLIEESA